MQHECCWEKPLPGAPALRELELRLGRVFLRPNALATQRPIKLLLRARRQVFRPIRDGGDDQTFFAVSLGSNGYAMQVDLGGNVPQIDGEPRC